MLKQRQRDAIISPLCEAGLLLIAGIAAFFAHQPLLFASLGPTAFELAEMPERKSAKPYSILMGHLSGVVSGFVALWMTGAWYTPAVSTSHITMTRVWASVVAAMLTVLLTILLQAQQPAALSTTLMIATGTMQRPIDGPIIMAGVLLIEVLGEPLRRWRVRQREQERARGEDVAG